MYILHIIIIIYNESFTLILYSLADAQWGFQRGKSTVTAFIILATIHDWLLHLDRAKEIKYAVFTLIFAKPSTQSHTATFYRNWRN